MKLYKKRILSILFAVVITISVTSTNIFAEGIIMTPSKNIKIDNMTDILARLADNIMIMLGSHEAFVESKRTVIDSGNEFVRPVQIDGRTLVPVRFIAEALKADVKWDENTQTVSISFHGKDIKAQLGSDSLILNNSSIPLEVPAQIIQGRTMLPLRAVSEALGKNVFWDERGLILIGDKSFNKEVDAEFIDKAIKLFGIYVSPNGNDSGIGTINSPFKTIEKAKYTISQLKKNAGIPIGGITVYLRGGRYQLDKSIEFTAEDSGTELAKIVYRNYPGEQAALSGGVIVNTSEAKKVVDKNILSLMPNESTGRVYQIDLKAQGIKNYGSISKVNFDKVPETLQGVEVFYDGKAQTIARYPNFDYSLTGEVINSKNSFMYEDDRTERWLNADDPWIDGYFNVNWAQETVGMKIDPKNKSITSSLPIWSAIGKGKRYFTYNLLEEIDVPGEWYIDRVNGIMYIYPPSSDIAKAKIELSMLDTPIINMKGVSNIILKGVTIETGRSYGVNFNSSNNCRLENCEIRNIGTVAVNIKNGSNIGVVGCQIHDIGMGGVLIDAGDRNTLTPGNVYVENCDIYYYSRIERTMTTGVTIRGVGNRVTNCSIHDAPHMGIYFFGNDHIIEGNEIYNVLQETDDAGAIYTGRDWSFRGIIIRNNFIHDLKLGTDGGHVYAIYLDDMMSGIQVYGNVIYNVNCAMIYGGGHDNIITNNISVDCPNNVIFDNRAENWAKKSVVEGGEMWYSLSVVPWESEIWQKKYPAIKNLFTSTKFAGIPQRNVMKNNIFINGEKLQIFQDVIDNGEFHDNIVTKEYLEFKDLKNLDLSLPKDSKLYSLLPEFQPVDFNAIGLQLNKDRSGYPVLDDKFNTISPRNGQNNVEGKSITFMWDKCKGADKYRIIVAKDANFENIVVDEIVPRPHFVATGFKYNNTKYYWKVEARSNGRTMLNEVNWNSNGVLEFVTKKEETLDKTELEALIQSTGNSFDGIVEGIEPGNYKVGSKEKLKAVFASAQAVLDDKFVKQKSVDTQIQNIKNTVDELNKSLINVTIGIDEIMDPTKWSAPKDMTLKDGTLVYTPTDPPSAYIGRKIGTNEILEFKMLMNLTTWQALSMHTQKTGVNLWETPNYSIIVKRDIFELQRYDEKGGGVILKTYSNNDIVVDGEWCDVVFGAVNTFNGVNIILKINGREIINYYDTNPVAMKKDGYLTLTNASVGGDPSAKFIIAPKK